MSVLTKTNGKYRDYVVYVLLVIISMIFMLSNQNRQIDVIKDNLVRVFSFVKNDRMRIWNYFNLRKKNEQLIAENTSLAVKVYMLKEMEMENKRLKRMLAFKQSSPLQLISAKVMGYTRHGLIKGIVVNVGENDGVRKNMAVVTVQGLVGRIYKANNKTSLVHVIADRNFRVSAIVQRSRVRGVVEYENGNFCRLNNVSQIEDVKIGDVVVTSGISDFFPAGIPIGKILEINKDPRSLFWDIKIELAANIDHLEEVFVIKKE